MYTVLVSFPGHGRYSGGERLTIRTFRDYAKARDYYTDMLLRYPNYNVEFLTEDKK